MAPRDLSPVVITLRHLSERFMGISSRLDGMPETVADEVVDRLVGEGYLQVEAKKSKKKATTVAAPPLQEDFDQRLLGTYKSYEDGLEDGTAKLWGANVRHERKGVYTGVNEWMADAEVSGTNLAIMKSFRLSLSTEEGKPVTGILQAIKADKARKARKTKDAEKRKREESDLGQT
jgi:hypothetical protein